MVRTQIYLDEEVRETIRSRGAGLAEFVREAVAEKLSRDSSDTAQTLKALNAAAGLWKDRDFTGVECQRRMRMRRPRHE